MTRKIPEHLENPVDNLIYKNMNSISKLAREFKLTPNMITTLSAIFGFVAIYFILKDKFIIGAVLYFISYYFDCLDGFYARKYDMVTKFGDYYDHIKDVFIFGALIYVLLKKKLYTGFIFVVPIILLTIAHFGCQELYYNKNESGSLNITKYFCPCKNDKSNLEEVLRCTRWLGSGTLILLFCIYLASYEFSEKNQNKNTK
jgi:phosphatidylglycerophosphate synthase